MKILVTFPDVPYYNWQVLVQINNLVKFGYDNNIIYVVGKQSTKELSAQIKNVLDNTPVEYQVYNDTRRGAKYPSSLRPHLLQKYFTNFPELSGETFFYIDPDLLFSKAIDFTTLLDKDTWYVSDTRSYLDSKYIKSKSPRLFELMCHISQIDKNVVINNDDNAGGAQYLMKNIDANYWYEVYKDSEKLYDFMKKSEDRYSPQHPIQSWTADMWAVLWNAWKIEHDVKISPKLSFSWATDIIAKFDEHNLFHNAGVANQPNLFNKTSYQTSPFNADFSHVSDKFCSYKYVEEIEETKNNYPNLINLF